MRIVCNENGLHFNTEFKVEYLNRAFCQRFLRTVSCGIHDRGPVPGKIPAASGILCAPMLRHSKLAFRCLLRKYDCDVCFTPVIIAADFMRSAKARDREFTTNKTDRPLIVQFAVKDAQTLADAACVVSPFSDGVDLNCGCPQRWAMSEGYGACLINKPELVKDMVRHVRNQIDNPNYAVSIKIRIAAEHGTPFTCFHHHLMYMLERITSQPERRVFNNLSSMSAVIDFLHNTYGFM